MATINDIKQDNFTIEKCRITQVPNGGWLVELEPSDRNQLGIPVAALSDTPSLMAYLGEKLNFTPRSDNN